MSKIKGIPVVSGVKVERDGVWVIKDGVKQRPQCQEESAAPRLRKPEWLKARVPGGEGYRRVRAIVGEHRLHTVCQESYCPNMGECWSRGTATFMVLGSVCTRACRFCSVDTGNPQQRLDADEPQRVAESVRLMGLRYVVITSVNRDDLPDGGAAHYAACVRAIQALDLEVTVEALTPDFAGDVAAIATVADSGLEVFAHNIETVRRLTPQVRDPRASYEQSLEVLAVAKRASAQILTKSSLMLGLGERDDEILEALHDLRRCGVDVVTLGQYLQPTRNHLPVVRYVSPSEWARWRQRGLELGFREVISGALVRSSYRAEQALAGNNVGLESEV
ncbi:lipoyl synthase [Halorhodospira abdelmalekii]|uniref:lipoyl synthase n=1 Tax=Halorhodospira abdelmalekii TaxID=421629 RepID=UPI001905F8A0|nr:lipoyl synthase [Halorhodospira abdelmalekii]MBK1735011.1 lipoyl synthase [Halorhodospira abdelmalekii]